MENKLDIETFGKIVDKIICDNDVTLVINFPVGTMEPTIESNLPGSVLQFYMIQFAAKKIFENMKKEMGLDSIDWPMFLDKLLDILKNSVLNEPGDYTPDCIKEE